MFDNTCALGKELVREVAVKEDFRLRVEKAQQGDARRQLVDKDDLWRRQRRVGRD